MKCLEEMDSAEQPDKPGMLLKATIQVRHSAMTAIKILAVARTVIGKACREPPELLACLQHMHSRICGPLAQRVSRAPIHIKASETEMDSTYSLHWFVRRT